MKAYLTAPFRDRKVWVVGIMTALVIWGAASFLSALGSDRQPAPIPAVVEGGHEVVAILLTAEFCAASNTPGFAEELRDALAKLEMATEANGNRLIKVGVSLDHDPIRGVAFLEKFGPLNEVMAGNNWFGSGAVSYIWRDHPGEGTLPQLILLERDVQIDSVANSIAVDDERVISRYVGLDEVTRWARELEGDT